MGHFMILSFTPSRILRITSLSPLFTSNSHEPLSSILPILRFRHLVRDNPILLATPLNALSESRRISTATITQPSELSDFLSIKMSFCLN